MKGDSAVWGVWCWMGGRTDQAWMVRWTAGVMDDGWNIMVVWKDDMADGTVRAGDRGADVERFCIRMRTDRDRTSGSSTYRNLSRNQHSKAAPPITQVQILEAVHRPVESHQNVLTTTTLRQARTS